MKKIFILIVLLIVASCSNSTKENEKPPVTVGEYSKQSVVMNGVINKILNEPDPKKMFTMVNFTRSGSITNDQRAELFKLYNDFHSEIIKSEKDVQARWKKYITTQNLK
jgi:broad specificity polyphosphatase/5'/3'-nucleotidase SurE